MIVLSRSEAMGREFPDMTRDELQIEWRTAKVSFDEALLQKTETDRIYVAAATSLNRLDRLMKKVAQREITEQREEARSISRMAREAVLV